MNKEILKILEEVHHVIKTYLNYSASTNYIQNSLYWYWLNIYWNWSEYVSESIKWRMHTTHKKKWIVSYTRTKRLYELYQTDLVKIATKQNIKKFKYIFAWVDNFSKYAWAIPIWIKEAIAVRNAIVHILSTDSPNNSCLIMVKSFLTT